MLSVCNNNRVYSNSWQVLFVEFRQLRLHGLHSNTESCLHWCQSSVNFVSLHHKASHIFPMRHKACYGALIIDKWLATNRKFGIYGLAHIGEHEAVDDTEQWCWTGLPAGVERGWMQSSTNPINAITSFCSGLWLVSSALSHRLSQFSHVYAEDQGPSCPHPSLMSLFGLSMLACATRHGESKLP